MMLSMRRATPGEVVRLSEDGPDYTVLRVSPCAAYLTRTWTTAVTKTDHKTGKVSTFTARGHDTIPVSLTAALWR